MRADAELEALLRVVDRTVIPRLPAPPSPEPARPADGQVQQSVLHGFAFDRAQLMPHHLPIIRDLAHRIAASRATANPVVAVEFTGYADSSGNPAYNVGLGLRRAQAVRAALLSTLNQRVAGRPAPTAPLATRTTSAGAGRPVASNRTASGRALNRRVAVTLRRRRRRPAPPAPSPLDIEILSPRPGQEFFIEPGNFPVTGPSMPCIFVSGRVLQNGQPLATGVIAWTLEVSGQYRVRQRGPGDCGDNCRLQSYSFTVGPAMTATGRSDHLCFEHFGFNLIVGGTLKVTAAFTSPAGQRVARSVTCKILGRNPTRAQVESLVRSQGAGGPCGDDSWALLRIFCHESAHRLAQFTGTGGVLFGPPAGVGIVQRDPEASEWAFPADRERQPNNFFPRIFWNWQENVLEGIRFFRTQKLPAAVRDLRSLRAQAARLGRPLPPFCTGVLIRAAIRRFNGGTEYTFRPRGRTSVYVVGPRSSNPGYVNNVLNDPHVTDPIPANVREVLDQESPVPGAPPCNTCTP